jgi:type VI secretion system protein ImpH
MRAAQRQFDAGLIQRLFDEPYRFEFFQAVRVIELWLRRHGVAHDRALADFVRFENSVSLGFPASDIEALSADAGERLASAAELLAALEAGKPARIRIRPAFMGFLGTGGALPLHYSERIAAHQHDLKDDGPRAFFDLFSSRALAQFYQAWAKYRVQYKLDGAGRDGYLPMLLALAGLEPREPGGEAGDDGIDQRSLAYFAAQLRARVVSAPVLGGVLAEYFAVPMAIEQFAGVWDVLAEGQRTRLGERTVAVGFGVTLGERLWRRDLGIRVRVGPVDRAGFDRFLPGAPAARALGKLLRMFATSVPHFEVQLVLRADEVRGARLDSGARLGLDAFVSTADEARDRGDVCYRLPPATRL